MSEWLQMDNNGKYVMLEYYHANLELAIINGKTYITSTITKLMQTGSRV